MPDIKIFVVCHKAAQLLAVIPFVPIQVGFGPKIEGVDFRDDAGDNIAKKNSNYCELTAQYWIWKNIKADYVGLCHYRRYLSFSRCADDEFTDFSEETCARFGWNQKTIAELLEKYDILLPPNWTIFPPGEPGHVMTPYEFHSYEHRRGDIDMALAVIDELTPEFSTYAKKALCEARRECFGNVCVMRKDLFDGYCEWLFKVLFEVEKRIVLPRNREEARLFGFLSERLIMVWLAYAIDRLNARVWFSPSMPFGNFPEDLHPALDIKEHSAVESPLLSVVIPVYNCERYLPKCLNSVCGQCLDEIEIICVDDRSTDGSRSILEDAATKDKRIIVVGGDHGGPGAARNKGVAVAKGKYLAFVDSDDWVDRFIWFRSVRKAERQNLEMVMFNVREIDDVTGKWRDNPWAQLALPHTCYSDAFTWRQIGRSPYNTCCYPVNRVIRRDLWVDIRFPEDMTIGEDALPHYQLLFKATRIGAIACPFYFYRQRNGSSMANGGEQMMDLSRLAVRMWDYANANPDVSALKCEFKDYVSVLIVTMFRRWSTESCFARLKVWRNAFLRELHASPGSSCKFSFIYWMIGIGNARVFASVINIYDNMRRAKGRLSLIVSRSLQICKRIVRSIANRIEANS